MHLFYNVLNRKSTPISHQITDAISSSEKKISDCQKRLNSEYGIKEMLIIDFKRSDDQHKIDYFQKQIIGINRSIKIRKRRIKKYENEIKELETALEEAKHNKHLN